MKIFNLCQKKTLRSSQELSCEILQLKICVLWHMVVRHMPELALKKMVATLNVHKMTLSKCLH